MCRLLGLAANDSVHLTFSLLQAPNSLQRQSRENPHGWGIAAYRDEWHLWKNSQPADASTEFEQRSHEASGSIIISHIRLATIGLKRPENNHPFRIGNWVLAHNGTVKGYGALQIGDFTPGGSTDSERILCALLYQLKKRKAGLENASPYQVRLSLDQVVKTSIRLDPACKINLLFSDGRRLFVFRHGHPLYWLIRTGDSATLQSKTLKMLQDAKARGEKAVLVATEKLTDENWVEVEPDRLFFIAPEHPELGLQPARRDG